MVAQFSQMPTLGELIKVARNYGWRLGKTPGVIGPHGEARIRYLRRGNQFVDLPDLRNGDRLTRIVVERLCRQAGLPPEDFGLSSE
jgi:hypothetical protein